MLFFNQNHGYLEGLVRGFKNGLLNQSEYQDFVQNHLMFRLFPSKLYRGGLGDSAFSFIKGTR